MPISPSFPDACGLDLAGVLAFCESGLLIVQSTVKLRPQIRFVVVSLLLVGCFPAGSVAKDEPKWIEVHTAHFSVLTDAGEKRGREVALRMEQMRAAFGQLLLKDKLKMPIPVTVIAFKSDNQYGDIAPAKQNLAGGFYVPGYDRVYIGLNLFQIEPWRAIAHSLGHYFLNFNYPPTQGWFDEGMAEYFGAVQIGKEVNIGGDPELAPEWHEDIFDNMVRDPSVPQSLTQLVSSPVWIGMVDLFTMKHDGSGLREGSHNTLYYAQSWAVVHYLINKKKMPEAGTYFDLALNQKVPVEKAIVQAFDLTPAQMEEAIRSYFNSLGNLGIALDQSKKPIAEPDYIMQPDHFPLPIGNDELGMAVSPVAEADAKALIDDMMARVPERRDHALRDLQAMTEAPKDNEPAHRGLARDHIQQKLFDAASDELEKAAELDPRDPWIWYYRSVLKYRKSQVAQQDMQGLANMMQDLRAVTDWYPEMADAYNLLGMARVEGGGINSALEAQRQAIALAPRNVEYQFNLGQIYVAAKKWDQAREIFTRLKESSDRQAAAASKRELEDMATLEKYGIRPQRTGEATSPPAGAASAPSADGAAIATRGTESARSGAGTAENASEDDGSDSATQQSAQSKPINTAPVENVKGKIVQSDCSKPPGAVVTIISGMTTYTMHSSDFKTMLVIGEDHFSCEWKNRPVSVNYRATGKNAGEVVSIELR
ncbi:MAG: tetratricopeptide repeat protein [Terriglobales bacterium]